MKFSMAANRRLLLAAALWAAVVVSGQEITRTQISDTIFNADGSRAVGSLRINWKSFTGADGSTVAKNSVDLDIIDGIVSVALAPNLGAVPDGTYYSVEYRLHKGQKSNELWIVPDSEDPVSIADIRVLSVPSAGMSVSLAQVNGLPAALAAKADKAAQNTFMAPQILREDAPGSSNPPLGLQKNDGSAGVYFRLPALSDDVIYTLPPNAGSPNQELTTDGSGALFWSSAAGGGAGSGSAYEVLQQGGTSVTQRTVANFTSGFVVSDNAGQLRTDITPNWGTAAGTITQGNDSRLSNARTPLAHASTHAVGNSDPLTPASIGALNRTNDFMVGASPTTPVLKVQGSTGQAAALQEWRDGSGALAALITAQGNGFFREIGVSAPTGGTTVSQFFEVGGLKKFALSATDGAFDILRYDNAGAFLDRPLRIFRSGKIETGVSMKVTDAGIGSGALGLTGDYVELQGVSAPSNAASGFVRLFLNSATGEVSVKKSSGSIVSLEGGGGGGGSGAFTDQGAFITHATASDALILGGASDISTKLAVIGHADEPTTIIRGASGQTADLVDFQTNSGASVASIGIDGTLSFAKTTTTGLSWTLGGVSDTGASRFFARGGDGASNTEPGYFGAEQSDGVTNSYLFPCGAAGNWCKSASAPSANSNDVLVSAAASPVWTGSHDYSGGQLELPNGTALNSSACDNVSEAGRIFINTSATTGRQIYYCEGASGWVEVSSNRQVTEVWNLANPTTGDSGALQSFFPADCTMKRVWCSTDSGTVTINLEERAESTPNTSGTAVLSSNLVCDSNSQATTTFGNASIGMDVPVALLIASVSGASRLRVGARCQLD